MDRRSRFASYKNQQWQHMVILENGLTKLQALDLEERLQGACKEGNPTGPPYRRKYSEWHRTKPYVRSAGQGSYDESDWIHSVYMAWWE